MIEPQLAAKSLAYEVKDLDRLPVVRADREKLQRIRLNLLSNSVKFTRAGGRVTVDSVSPDHKNDRVVVRVTDTGEGIPADKLHRIFDAFTQVDATHSRNRKQRLKYLAARAADVADGVVFIGERADYGRRRAIDAGLSPETVHAFPSLQAAAEFLRGELRAGDLVLLKGRTTDHAARIFFAQIGHVACWKDYCSKRMLCDTCWELGVTRQEMNRAELVTT